ncbi:MAG: 1-phosphofructokinase family hexose kinase [Candidatus Promineifilaceae bacterium]|jgi:6-phosphofructokinase 2
MGRIVTLAMNPSLDKSTRIENVVPEKKLRCEIPEWQAGGGAINVARVVKRLGGSALAVYTAGGPQGMMLRNLLDEEEIVQEVISIAGITRESFSVRETASNQQYRFSVPGPTISASEWKASLRTIEDLNPLPDYLVLSGGLPPGVPDDFYGRIAKWAQENGIRVILDTHHEPFRHAVEAGVFWIKPNLRELRQLTGQRLETEEAQQEAIQRIIKRGGAQYIVLSLGAAGAVFADANGTQHLRAPTVKIRSKVGAGDSMVGGIVWALSQNYAPLAAAKLGVAAGAATVKTPGSELCQREDVLKLFDQIDDEESGEPQTH